MGRHAAKRAKPNLAALAATLFSQLKFPKLALPRPNLSGLKALWLERRARTSVRPKFQTQRALPRFAVRSMTFSASLLLVTAVDPYSGNLASASSIIVGNSIYSDSQSLLVKHRESEEFARGGFEILTGAEARKLFVANAPLPDPGTAKAIGLAQVEELGWEYNEYSCLVKLWDRESNWRWNAHNKSSGAYGIPQALPGSKMASAGDDWQTNPATQIKWGLKYIENRYKTPCGALAHSDEHNWY